MDRELSEARRNADPTDRASMARLAVIEARVGEGPNFGSWRPLLKNAIIQCVASSAAFLTAPDFGMVRRRSEWVFCWPGDFLQLDFIKQWMFDQGTWKDSVIGIARNGYGDRDAAAEAERARRKLVEWSKGPMLTEVRRAIPCTYCSGAETSGFCPACANQPTFEVLKVERVRATWTVEAVRIACGLDPLEEEVVSRISNSVKVGRCNTQNCTSDARERPCGCKLCFECNKDHWCK